MRSPEELAANWLAQFRGDTGAVDRADLADLLRQRDAEHAELRREERGRAFDAGAEIGARRQADAEGRNVGWSTEAEVAEAFAAARRAAVESAGEPGEEQP